VKKLLIPGALAVLVAAPAFAQSKTSLDQVMKDLAALTDRVGRLEQDNTQLKTENATLKAENDRLEATSEYLKDNATATRKQLAEEAPQVAASTTHVKGADWASRISFKADTRYRYESVDPEAAVEQQRQRIRARFAMTAKINDTLSGTIGLATNGGTGDPRSTNQTLGEGWTRKGIGLDLAYVDWKPVDSFGMSFGKMPQPWYKVSGYFFDNDINPEGIAARFGSGMFFASAFSMALSERGTASDASLLGGQLGLTGQIGGMKLTGALGYFDVASVQGEVTTTIAALPCTANPAFFGGPQGNTTVNIAPLGCPTLLNDFNMIEALAQAEFTIANQPLQIFAQYVQNEEANDLDNGWFAGFNWGKASAARSWEFGYAYGVIEKDAMFGQFVDSDWAGGTTDAEGSVFKVGFAPAKNWVLNGTYFMNQRFVDAPGAIQRGYDRYQVDLNWKF
jgi:regulator of replication initiation timing